MDDEIIGEFLVECFEGLDRLEQGLVVLEETPDDTPTLTEVFRILHTIKGTCGFLDFSQLETVAHRGESLLSLLRDQVIEIDEEITDALLATNDAIREILGTIEQTGAEGTHDMAELIATLEALSARADHAGDLADVAGEADGGDGDSDIQVAAEPVEVEAEPVEVEPEPIEQAEHVEHVESVESDGPLPTEDQRIGDVLVEDGSAARTDVEVAAAEQSLGDERPIGRILVDEGRAERADVEAAAAKQRSAASSSIRVDVEVLDGLMNLVGELVLSRNQIVQLAGLDRNVDFAAPAQRLNLLTSELQESVMKTRMQPIGTIWNKLPRVVRDLSNQFGKRIRLEMEGKETELDRTILEAIKDPLTHMIRNTVDHGIETPERRAAVGKETEGVLRLIASHEGGQVNIEIIDDGAGIDADAIRRLAVEKRVVSAEQADAMNDQAAIQLIFRPGFSTASSVSNVSGRGVGMDVVRTNIERIGGSVDIKTTLGAGTSFKVKIPLTLAIIPAIIIRCDGNRYAIPQPSIQELVRLDENQRIEDVHGAPVYRLRDRLLPIVDLRSELCLEPSQLTSGSNVVVLNVDGRSFGLVVDAIDDTEEIVIKPLGRTVRDNPVFSGATVMGDGSVALILDVTGVAVSSGVMNAAAAVEAEAALERELASTTQHDDRTILVVGLNGGQRVAVALDQVDRLEDFPTESIEWSGHRQVVQYRGEVMPLADLGPLAARGGSAIDTDERVSVVVCSAGDHAVGLVVDEILDIVSKPEIQRGGDEHVATAVVDGELVDLVDIAEILASAGIQIADHVSLGV